MKLSASNIRNSLRAFDRFAPRSTTAYIDDDGNLIAFDANRLYSAPLSGSPLDCLDRAYIDLRALRSIVRSDDERMLDIRVVRQRPYDPLVPDQEPIASKLVVNRSTVPGAHSCAGITPPDIPDQWSVTTYVGARTLRAALRDVSRAMATTRSSYPAGVHLEPGDGRATLSATDGYHAISRVVPWSGMTPNVPEAIIPRAVVLDLIAIEYTPADVLRVDHAAGAVRVTLDGVVTMTARTIEGAYPNWRIVTTPPLANTVVLPRDLSSLLVGILRRDRELPKEDPPVRSIVWLTVAGGRVKFEDRHYPRGRRVTIARGAGDAEFMLDARYLLDMVRSRHVVMHYTPGRALTFEPVAGVEGLGVLMPVWTY